MDKLFLPTFLYIKIHNVTGLKYFGKTSGQDPYKYRGSGTYWLAHLRIHGNDVTTEIFGFYTDKELCIKDATNFSISNDIVNAVDCNGKKKWANQIIENGLDGGATWFGKRSEELCKKLSGAAKNRKISPEAWQAAIQKAKDTTASRTYASRKGKTQTLEAKEKIKKARANQIFTDETRAKMSKSQMGHEVTLEARAKIAKSRTGKKATEETLQKMRARVVTEETKEKLRIARASQVCTDETREKLSGKVVVVDKQCNKYKIPKDQYLAQTGPKADWEWVAHRSKEAIDRMKNIK